MKSVSARMTLNFVMLILAFAVISGCRGQRSKNSPVHMNPNMDHQTKGLAQEYSFDIPKGTVGFGQTTHIEDPARDQFLKENTAFYLGKNAAGEFVRSVPMEVNQDIIKRGQERFNIYCGVCHDRAGSGKSLIVKRGLLPPPDLADQRIREMVDGELFNIITEGVRNMPGYKAQIPARDRWAIVTYVRALQKSRFATEDDVPSVLKEELK